MFYDGLCYTGCIVLIQTNIHTYIHSFISLSNVHLQSSLPGCVRPPASSCVQLVSPNIDCNPQGKINISGMQTIGYFILLDLQWLANSFLVPHCQTALEYGLATLLIYSGMGEKNALGCLDFFAPMTTCLSWAGCPSPSAFSAVWGFIPALYIRTIFKTGMQYSF